MSSDWKSWTHGFPYTGLDDPEYIKAREETFNKHGNGWWWKNGWWNGHTLTPRVRQQQYRAEREKQNV
tara:strand:+ start:45 stop:248 length:204 start_codon:yes stop_codon:yes gene_type:complete